jgi:hypothetical protein
MIYYYDGITLLAGELKKELGGHWILPTDLFSKYGLQKEKARKVPKVPKKGLVTEQQYSDLEVLLDVYSDWKLVRGGYSVRDSWIRSTITVSPGLRKVKTQIVEVEVPFHEEGTRVSKRDVVRAGLEKVRNLHQNYVAYQKDPDFFDRVRAEVITAFGGEWYPFMDGVVENLHCSEPSEGSYRLNCGDLELYFREWKKMWEGKVEVEFPLRGGVMTLNLESSGATLMGVLSDMILFQ